MSTPVLSQEPNPSADTLRLSAPCIAVEPRDPRPPSSVRSIPVTPEHDFPRIRGYEILSVVGRGAMGIVYEARHCELNRRVAVKMLRGDALLDPTFRERFRAEAEAIARLQHPNIIQVFEVGTADSTSDGSHGSPFIALEFVDGGSLARCVGTPQAPRYAAGIVETLARAAHVAHSMGVIHRDLKPANILLGLDGEPKIADFGIARQLDSGLHTASRCLTLDNSVMGTPEYMSPEQLNGVPATAVCDVYSLGAILYEMLTGRVPFQGTTVVDTIRLTHEQDPVPPRRLQPGVPRDLETVCLRSLEKNPAKRYPSAAALADDLALWAAGRTIRARPAGPTERAVRWTRRNPSIAALSLATVLIALVGSLGIVWQWDDARSSAKAAKLEAGNATESARKERWERYRVSTLAASGSLGMHNVNSARRWLDDAPGEYRDWVWNVLHTRVDRSTEVLRTPGDAIDRVRFSPDGRWAYVRRAHRTIYIRDVATKREFGPFESETDLVAPAISDDGSSFAYGESDSTIVVRDVATGRTRAVLRGHTGILCRIEFTSDSARVFSIAPDGTARIWDAATGAMLSLFRTSKEVGGFTTVSPDGRFVVGNDKGDGPFRIWELATGREVSTLDGHRGAASIVEFGPGSSTLVTTDPFPSNVVRVWDVATGRLQLTMSGHQNFVMHVAFGAGGTRMLTASLDRTVRVWDTSPGTVPREARLVHVLKGHTGWVEDAAFSPDGTRIVSASHDDTLRYWSALTGETLAVLHGHTNEVWNARFLADGAGIVSASRDGTLRIWDVLEVERDYAICGHEKFVYGVAFHPGGARVASSGWDGTARIWDATTGRQLRSLDHGTGAIVASVAWHPNGSYLATYARDDAVRLWDADSGRELHRWHIPTSDWRDSRVNFSPSGSRLAAGSPDGRVHLWDVETRKEVAVHGKHADAVRDVAFSPDGRWLASGGEVGDRTIRIWDVDTGEQVRELRGHTAGVYSLAWNPSGTLLASGGTDGTIRLWDTSTWAEVRRLHRGHNTYSVAFSPDGRLLASGGADNTIRICDVKTGQDVAELTGHAEYVHQLAFDPDGTRLISASGDRTLRVWDSLSRAERTKRSGTPAPVPRPRAVFRPPQRS